MALLERLLQQVDHPLQLLSALTDRFRQLLLVKALAARRLPRRRRRSWRACTPTPYGKLAEHAGRPWTGPRSPRPKRLLEADLAIKSGYDPRLTLETVVAELVGE